MGFKENIFKNLPKNIILNIMSFAICKEHSTDTEFDSSSAVLKEDEKL